MKNITKAVKVFKNISNEKDLRKNKLTLSEYQDLQITLQSIINEKSGTTLLKNVADWCKRNNLNVQEQSIYYKITV